MTYDYRYRDANGALALDGNGDPFQALEATSVTGVDGHTSVRSYDALHRLRYSTTSGADPTYYAYDVADSGWFHRLQLLRDGGSGLVPTVQWSFAMGSGYSTRPTRLRRSSGATNEDTTYAYNAAGELVSVIAPDATETTFEYDEVGRTTRACHNSGCTERDEFTYDVLRDRLTATSSVNASGSTDRTLSYGATTVVADPMPTATLPNADRVVGTTEHTYAGMTLTDTDTATFTHDVLGRPASVTHDSETLSYQYDTAGRFTGLVDNSTTPATTVVGYQYPTSSSSAPPRRPTYQSLPRTNCVRDFLYQSQSDDLRMYSSWFFNASTWSRQASTDLSYTADGRLNSEQDESIWRCSAVMTLAEAMDEQRFSPASLQPPRRRIALAGAGLPVLAINREDHDPAAQPMEESPRCRSGPIAHHLRRGDGAGERDRSCAVRRVQGCLQAPVRGPGRRTSRRR